MNVDFEELSKQYSGRRVAELVLLFVRQLDTIDRARTVAAGLMDELRPDLRESVLELIDFLSAMPQDEQRKLFSDDLGRRFIEVARIASSLIYNRNSTKISEDEAFTIFMIVVNNWAMCCLAIPQTKAAMQKAAGVGFFRRFIDLVRAG